MEYNVYQHLDCNGTCVYVGLTKNMVDRQRVHMKEGAHKEEIKTIIYAPVRNKTEMEIYEKYYINKLSPKYNIKDNRDDDMSNISLEDLTFLHYKDVAPEDLVQGKNLSEAITIEEANKFLASFNTACRTGLRNKTICSVLLSTGMKASECYAMIYNNLNVKEGYYKLGTRKIHIPAKVITLIGEVNKGFGHNWEGHIFTSVKGVSINESYMRKMLSEQAVVAGLTCAINSSSFRHAFASELSKHTDVITLQEYLGVKEVSLVLRYITKMPVDIATVIHDSGMVL